MAGPGDRGAARAVTAQPLALGQARLVVERGDARLLVRAVAGSTGLLLLLEERITGHDQAALRRLGLSPRESEVLAPVADGLTNPAIAARLGRGPAAAR